jgi:glycosyltransferase involved in cell wall biosynthesis
MRIALYHNLTSGGSKREAYELATQFVRHGHTVHLYAPRTANEEFLPLTNIAQRAFRFDLHLSTPLGRRLPFLRRYVDLARLAQDLRRLQTSAQTIAARIDFGGYDFVFVHHDQIVQSPYLLRYLKTPSVYYCAEPMREFYEPSIPRPYDQLASTIARLQRLWYAPERWIRRRWIKAEDRRNVRSAKILLTNSAFSAESIYRAYGLRACISYLGVDTEKFRSLDIPRQEFVLTVGAVSPLKGYDFLIRALSHVPDSIRPRLVVVGNTASAGEMIFLQRLAEQFQVALEFRVNVSEDELVTLYNQARAFVYSPVLEPFGLTVLEAMVCEIPVVAVREGGVRESVRDGETGLLVQREPRDFAEALCRVLNDTQFAQSLGKRGRESVLEFWTWEHAYHRLIENVTTGLSRGMI